MEKGKFAKLAEFFGIKVNEDALELVENEYDADMPDNWDEMSEEEKAAWKEKHMMRENAQTPAAVKKPAPAADENTIWLKSLIEGIGGREAFQALLLSAVKAVELQQNSEANEKETVIAALVQNAEGRLTAEELKDMDLPVLQKMAKAIAPQQQLVDYRMQGAGTIRANKDDVAVMPDIFAAEFWKEK